MFDVCIFRDDEDEVLVYGPINREPEEKLFPWRAQHKNSGIRKL